MTRRTGLALCAALLAFAAVTASSGAARPAFREHRVVFVTITGHGAVTSSPRGIDCPVTCRSAGFFKSEIVRLIAKPASGWRLRGWSSGWCARTSTPACVLTLVDSHDCARGACPIGAFGVRVTFVPRSASD